jgi:hypothetical protein
MRHVHGAAAAWPQIAPKISGYLASPAARASRQRQARSQQPPAIGHERALKDINVHN